MKHTKCITCKNLQIPEQTIRFPFTNKQPYLYGICRNCPFKGMDPHNQSIGINLITGHTFVDGGPDIDILCPNYILID